jgi:hypothetical protein
MASYRRPVSGKFIASAVAAGLILAAAQGHGHLAGGRAAVTVAASGSSNEALANQMAAAGYGWTGQQATCLDDLWNHESGFDAYAANPTSDARGIPQNISGWSANYQPGNARQQIAWGLSYVQGRYGTPCAAWAFEMSHYPNWY